MVSEVLVTVLAYAHVLSAMGWLGGGILTMFVLGPNVAKLSPAAMLEFNAKVIPKIGRAIQMFIGMTFLFGLLFLYTFSNGNLSFLGNSSQGMAISSGMLVGLIAAIVGWAVTFPSFKKIAALSASALAEQKPPPPEMAKFGKRARMGALLSLLLLLLALALMVAAGFYYGYAFY